MTLPLPPLISLPNGDKRAKDGRWPLVIDPSGKTSIFLSYQSAFVFTALDLKDSIANPELAARMRSSLLKALMYDSSRQYIQPSGTPQGASNSSFLQADMSKTSSPYNKINTYINKYRSTLIKKQ